MLTRTVLLSILSILLLAPGCAFDLVSLQGTGIRPDTGMLPVDGAVGDARPTFPDAGTPDADPTLDAGTDAAGPTGLDPRLEVPPETNTVCTSRTECGHPLGDCRIYNATEYRCEAAIPGATGVSCDSGADCSGSYLCFDGTCRPLCGLGLTGCGSVELCVDMGHPVFGWCNIR